MIQVCEQAPQDLTRSPILARRTQAAAGAPLLQRCGGGKCTCGGGCQSQNQKRTVEDDTLTPVLRAAVQERALQRATQPASPATALLQRACSSARLSQLQSSMHSWCDSGISCRGNMSCDDINDRWNAGNRCLSLRQQIQSECYDNNTDAGHAEAIATVQNAVDFCDRKWRQQRC
jgi:hypothetical protein